MTETQMNGELQHLEFRRKIAVLKTYNDFHNKHSTYYHNKERYDQRNKEIDQKFEKKRLRILRKYGKAASLE